MIFCKYESLGSKMKVNENYISDRTIFSSVQKLVHYNS